MKVGGVMDVKTRGIMGLEYTFKLVTNVVRDGVRTLVYDTGRSAILKRNLGSRLWCPFMQLKREWWVLQHKKPYTQYIRAGS